MATSRPSFNCDTCDDEHSNIVAGLCKECKEIYCAECLNIHKTFKATENHPILVIGIDLEAKCDTCFKSKKGNFPAVTLCTECWELYCESCKKRHLKFTATKDHDLLDIAEPTKHSDQQSTRKSYTSPREESEMKSTPIPEDSVNLSSDFEGFNIEVNKEILGAQTPVLSSRDRKQQYKQKQKQQQQQHIKQLDKKAMDNISVRMVTTFNGKVQQDAKDCNFMGIICLNDGRLVLLDMDNKKLKLFNTNFQIICTEPTKDKLWEMTKVSEDVIAVVNEDAIYLYTVTGDRFVLQDKVFKLDGDGYGISYSKGRYAVACNIFLEKDPFITICSDTGKEIHRITSFKYKPCNMINLDSVDECLYVSPYKSGDKFTCLSLQGQLLWEMDFVGQNVVELYNRLLITDINNNAKHMCAKNGTYRRKLIQDRERLHGPTYIAYNSDTQQVFVTCLSNNNITVLQLSY